MMALIFSVTMDDSAVMTRLRRLQAQVTDLTLAMSAIGVELKSRISLRFENEQDPMGHRWKAWQPATQKRYPRDGNRRLLDRYSDMIDSLGFKADNQSVIVGFGQPYAAYHEFGTKKMARRGLLFADPVEGTLAPEDVQAVLDILNHMIQNLARE